MVNFSFHDGRLSVFTLVGPAYSDRAAAYGYRSIFARMIVDTLRVFGKPDSVALADRPTGHRSAPRLWLR